MINATYNNNLYWNEIENIPEKIKTKVNPYLFPYQNPATQTLMEIFRENHSFNANHECFIKSGFTRFNGTKAYVGSHKKLDPHNKIIKASPGWNIGTGKKMLRRVQAHEFGASIIAKYGLTEVKVTKNWLFPLPQENKKFDISASLKKIFCLCQKDDTKKAYDQFVVVEEYCPFDQEKYYDISSVCSKKFLDEVEIMIMECCFDDSHGGNCPLINGKLVFLDLEVLPSKLSPEERKDYQLRGLQTFLRRVPEPFKDYWNKKIENLTNSPRSVPKLPHKGLLT